MNTDPTSGREPERNAPHPLPEVRGAGRLLIDAIVGVTDIVESMHRNISGLAPLIGPAPTGRTTGIPGLVYRSIRGLSRLVGTQLDTALAQLAPLLTHQTPSPERDAVVAALNGVFGDHLAASGNPLAIPMRLRRDGHPLTLNRQALDDDLPSPSPKLLVLMHGLCMSDRGWHRDGHDHGASLGRALGYTPLYLHYNSGQPISTNGRDAATLLEQLLQEWPVPVRELAIIGHSMGGLVARSACHYAGIARHTWPQRLNALAFLGTPHHGAPLERAGSWVDLLAGMSPYTAPLSRLGTIRSAGIKDLRYGTLVDGSGTRKATARTPVPLPENTACFAIAASKDWPAAHKAVGLQGDGLVSVRSALGWHKDPARTLSISPTHQRIVHDLSHFDLLSNREVYDQLHRWLAQA